MEDSLAEEFKHFSMDLEFLLRRKPKWRQIARGTLFQDGDIVANGGAAEVAAASGSSPEVPAKDSARGPGRPDSSLGIGSLREDFA
jgi:hypothetical protein